MAQSTEIAILPFKVLELAQIIAEKKRLSLTDALFYLYNSDLYHNLPNPDFKLWYHSGSQLYDLLEEEKSPHKRTGVTRAEARFFIFCVEQFRLRGNLPSAGVLEMFIRLKVNKFLIDNFEALHTQSAEYILHEIDIYLKRR